MLDRNQLKTQGLRYARSLRMVFKTVSMFSTDHVAARTAFQQSFDLLNPLLKQTGQFTIGFVDHRVMLNNMLTTEHSLSVLENEFFKRGLGAITFQAGMTLAAYRRGIGAMAQPAKAIEEAGGLARHLEQNPVEFMRIFPASKSQKRTESGDTVLDMDSESYLVAKVIQEMRPASGGAFQSFEAILQSAGMGGASLGETAGAGGTGDGLGARTGGAGTGQAQAQPNNFGSEVASGSGPSVGAGGGPTEAALGPCGGLIQSYLQATLLDPAGAPQRSFLELAQFIRDMRPELVLSHFSPERREHLRTLPPDQMAAEVIEDTAVHWAAQHLATAPTGPEAYIVEEEVIRVLLHCLQSAHTAERLAIKLARYFRDLAIPKHITTRICEDLTWVVVPKQQKIDTLLGLSHFERHEFRRLLELARELIKDGEHDNVTLLAHHYAELLKPENQGTEEEIGRIPELFAAMASVRSDFWPKSAALLTEALHRTGGGSGAAPTSPLVTGQQYRHWKILECILAFAKNLAIYEEFALIQFVGGEVERMASQESGKHRVCCGAALQQLLTPGAIDRIVEIFLQKKDEPTWERTAAILLRWSGPPAIAKLLQLLEDESLTINQRALVRLVGRIGLAALDLVCQRLNHERWYMVRNACQLLVELKDPDLLAHLAPVLRHPDERVQKAVADAIMKSHSHAAAQIFAEALPYLRANVLEDALGELLFQKAPSTVPALERFIFHQALETKEVMMAVQAVAVIPSEHVEELLGTILINPKFDLVVRRVAMIALVRSTTARSARLLNQFIRGAPQDPMAHETDNTLKALGRAIC